MLLEKQRAAGAVAAERDELGRQVGAMAAILGFRRFTKCNVATE